MREALSVFALVGTGVVAGVMFAVAISVVPALLRMTPEVYVQTHKLLGRHYDRVMPFVVVGSAVAELLLVLDSGTTWRRAWFIAGAVLMLGVAVVSQTGNVPINRRVKALPAGDVPDDWDDPRGAWRHWHRLRTGFALCALAVTATGVVTP
ncbi:DUF1772 domain-containing protein [Lentzea albidocapillata]|uniref:anthrone oxygenase family protein n=1 Tax=Lentzea albidocapillata TaxID=40571 RepID=UPI00210C4888|nr:DUF1772 domain-containing protein [Lentzea albidocapillata]